MEIRLAQPEDLEEIMEIYAYARAYQARTGNPTQWADGYPARELLEEDIALQRLYLCEEDGKKAGVFVFYIGEDPCYRVIYDGAWLDDGEYGVVHRIAGNGTCRGMAAKCFDFCFARCKSVRIDTYKDNRVMQHVLEKYGFTYCGGILLENGAPRMAYQMVR